MDRAELKRLKEHVCILDLAMGPIKPSNSLLFLFAFCHSFAFFCLCFAFFVYVSRVNFTIALDFVFFF